MRSTWAQWHSGCFVVAVLICLPMTLRHEGRTVLATWHPSYALRAPEPAARESAYLDIVTALEHARRLAAGK